MRYFKSRRMRICAAAIFTAAPALAAAQVWNVTTVMGYGLRMPTGVVVDAAGSMFVADDYDVRILHKYTLDESGAYVSQADVADGLHFDYLALDTAGNVYASEPAAVHKYAPNGSGGYTQLADVANSGLTDVQGIALDAAGRVYVADGSAHVTHIYAPNSTGSYVQQGYVAASNSDVENSGVAVDRSGNVYVSDSWRGVIHKFTPNGSGGFTQQGDVASGGTSFASLAVDKAGNVYVTDYDTIRHYAPNGAGGYTEKGDVGSGWLYPYGIAIDAHGDLYICDAGHARIRKAVSETIFIGGFESLSNF